MRATFAADDGAVLSHDSRRAPEDGYATELLRASSTASGSRLPSPPHHGRGRSISDSDVKTILEEDVRMESEGAAYDSPYLRAASALMGTILQAKSTRKLIDPVHYNDDRDEDEIKAAANRKVARWRQALGLVGVVDVVLLLALLLGLFAGRLDKFWIEHVQNYDFNTSDADVALLVLCRGLFNFALATYVRREAWLLGKGTIWFWTAVASLNAITFVAMIVKAALLQWGPTSRADSDSTVSAAALTLFLLTGLMEAPIVYYFLEAVRLKQSVVASSAAEAAAAAAAARPATPAARLTTIPSELEPDVEPPSIAESQGETIYTSLDLERGDVSLARPQDGPGGKKRAGSPAPTRGLSRRQILLVLQPYFWPSRKSLHWFQNRVRCVAVWVLIAASKVTTVMAPLYLSKAVNYLGGKEGTADGAATTNLGKAAMSAVLFCALTLMGVVFQELQTLLYLGVRKVACAEVSQETFKHILGLSMQWQIKAKIGKTIRAIDRGMDSVNTIVAYIFLTLVPALGEAVAVIIIFVAHYGQWDSSLLLFVGLLLFGIVTVRITNRRRYYRQLSNQKDSEIHERATDSLVNFETVKAFTNEPFEQYKYKTGVWAYQQLDAETDASLSYLTMAQGFILLTFQMGILLLTVRRVVDGNMNVGDFVAINKYVDNAFAPLKVLSSVYNSVSKALVDMANLNTLLAEIPDIVDKASAPAFAFNKDATRIKTAASSNPQERAETKEQEREEDGEVDGLGNSIEVKFDDITFHYQGQNPERGLKHVSFTIKPGTTTAVVGHTGSGKSTLARLLFRFYDPLGGAVRFNGEDIKTFRQRSIRKAIGVVPQDTCLFNDTLLNNIRYGRLDAAFEEIEAAVEAAQLTPFIHTLSHGYDTMVGERGLKLSGGEKQRVAIARCILKNPPIVLLDEATSALDTKTEKEITDALNRLGRNRTMLVVAHRLSTVKNANQIIVMDKGCIAEMGTHDELLALGGQYRHMWDLQVNKDDN